MRRALSVFFILFFSIYIVTLRPAYAVKKEQPPNVIPLYTSTDGLFIFDVTINDTDTFPVILDTAAGMSALRANKLSQLNAPKTNQDRLVHGLIAKEITETFNIEKISSGPISYSGHVLSITDHDAIDDFSVQGVIGTDVLSQNNSDNRYLLVNFRESEIRFSNKMRNLVQPNTITDLRWKKLTYTADQMTLLTIPVKIADIRATAILDTGIKFSVINTPLAKKLEKRGRHAQEVVYTDVNGEEASMKYVLMDRMRASKMSWGPTSVVIYDAPALSPLDLNEKPSILLGLNYLKETAIVIDRKLGRIAFAYHTLSSDGPKSCTGSRINCMSRMGQTFVTDRKRHQTQ